VFDRFDLAAGEADFEPAYDVDGNGRINLRDMQLVQAQFGASCEPSTLPTQGTLCQRGDVDSDGTVEMEDYDAVDALLDLQAGDEGFDPRYDFNENERIDLSDLLVILGQVDNMCTE
jgi:hypothetical protein